MVDRQGIPAVQTPSFNINVINSSPMKVKDKEFQYLPDEIPESSLELSKVNKIEDVEINSKLERQQPEYSVDIKKSNIRESEINESAIGISTYKNDVSLSDNSASEDIADMLDHEFHGIDRDLIKQELRFRIYKLVKHHVHEKRDNNECRSDVVRTIKTLCNICNDHIDQQICFHEYSKTFIGNHNSLELLSKLSKMPIIGRFFLRSLSRTIFYEYQFLDTLISICNSIVKDLKTEEISEAYKKEAEMIREEMIIDIHKLGILEESFIVQFSGFVNFIRTKMAAYNLIQYQKSQVNHFEHLGMVDEGEKETWMAKLDSRFVDVNSYKPREENIEIINVNTFSLDYPIFSCLNEKENEILLESKYLSEYKKGGKFANLSPNLILYRTSLRSRG